MCDGMSHGRRWAGVFDFSCVGPLAFAAWTLPGESVGKPPDHRMDADGHLNYACRGGSLSLGALVRQIGGQLAAIRGERRHQLLVQPDVLTPFDLKR